MIASPSQAARGGTSTWDLTHYNTEEVEAGPQVQGCLQQHRNFETSLEYVWREEEMEGGKRRGRKKEREKGRAHWLAEALILFNVSLSSQGPQWRS